MTLGQKMLIIWSLATAIGLVVMAPWSPPEPSNARLSVTSSRWPRIFLVIIAGALVVVGLVSNTLVIHAVQITPLLVVAALLLWKPAWSAIAAVPLFIFWLLIMGGIWLFLLGVSRFFTGRFSPTEILLTAVIGAASLAGLTTSYRSRSMVPIAIRVATVVGVGAVQAAALWLSYHPIVTSR